MNTRQKFWGAFAGSALLLAVAGGMVSAPNSAISSGTEASWNFVSAPGDIRWDAVRALPGDIHWGSAKTVATALPTDIIWGTVDIAGAGA